MKRLTLIFLVLSTAAILLSEEVCTRSADCGILVEATIPDYGSCRVNDHDKRTTLLTYDPNGTLYDIGTHDCNIGPC